MGRVSIAASARGVCRVAFNEGEDDLRRCYPHANLVKDGDADFATLAARVVAAIEHPGSDHTIPLDIVGTAFQQQVWAALRTIPCGETRSYGELAAMVGNPKASRAVGSANGANKIAVLIPCHRVVQTGGGLGGYAYGMDIKAQLLRREKDLCLT